MTEWTFRLAVRSIELTDEQLDALHEAGCDDGSFALEPDGTVLGFFDREAESESAAVGARVVKVAVDGDWLTASEIADGRDAVERSALPNRRIDARDRDHPSGA